MKNRPDQPVSLTLIASSFYTGYKTAQTLPTSAIPKLAVIPFSCMHRISSSPEACEPNEGRRWASPGDADGLIDLRCLMSFN